MSLASLFGFGPKVDVARLLAEGAMIVDVRTPEEFSSGNVKGSINIPVGEILRHLSTLRKDVPVITCCRSGARSASAASILKDHGFNAHNGGPWTKVRQYLIAP